MTPARLKHSLVWFLIIFYAAYYGVILLDLPILKYSDIIEILGTLVAIPALAYAVCLHRPGRRLPWVLFLATAVQYCIADVLWAYFSHTSGEPEVPSVCDIFYISNTITVVFGFIAYLRLHKRVSIANLSFDIFLTAFAAAGIIYLVAVLPIVQDKSISMLSTIVQACYPIGDILLFVIILVLCLDTSRISTPHRAAYLLLASHCLLAFAADQLNMLNDNYELGISIYLDPLWGSIEQFLAIAGLYDYEADELTKGRTGTVETNLAAHKCVDFIRTALPYVLTFSVLGYVFVRRGLNDAPSVWAIILFSLLCLRQIFVITTNRKLLIVQQKIEKSLHQKNQELEQLNQKIQHDATIDFLTNLYNRRHIEKIVDSLTPSGKDAQDVGLLIIDLDYFKRINDTFGHQAGDEVLQKVAYTIRDVLREGDVAGRYGGDEFIAILPCADHDQVKTIAEKLTEAVESNTQLAMYGVTLSIGASSWHVAGSGYSFHKQFKLTDDALYEAKRNGRHQTRLIQIT